MTKSTLDFLRTLEDIIVARAAVPVDGSYTSALFAAGPQRIAQKVAEEAVEVALASTAGDREQTTAEAADLVYHLLVLLAGQRISLEDVIAILRARHTEG